MDKLPPGFCFSPSDEELVGHFLYRKTMALSCQPDIIPTLDLRHFDPWELNGKALQGGKYWYFFARRTHNRASNNGYWNAIEDDETVTSSNGIVGMKRTLVFYESREDIQANWMMHEYHLLDTSTNCSSSSTRSSYKNRREPRTECNKWVLCRAFDADCDSRTSCHDNETQLSCLDEVFLSLDDLDEISLLK